MVHVSVQECFTLTYLKPNQFIVDLKSQVQIDIQMYTSFSCVNVMQNTIKFISYTLNRIRGIYIKLCDLDRHIIGLDYLTHFYNASQIFTSIYKQNICVDESETIISRNPHKDNVQETEMTYERKNMKSAGITAEPPSPGPF